MWLRPGLRARGCLLGIVPMAAPPVRALLAALLAGRAAAQSCASGEFADSLALASIDISAETVTLSSAPAGIAAGDVVRLGSAPGQTCTAAPLGSDLTVAGVSGAVLTFTTDLTDAGAGSDTNCVVQGCTACTPVANAASAVTCTSAIDSRVTACAAGYRYLPFWLTNDSTADQCLWECDEGNYDSGTGSCTPCAAGQVDEDSDSSTGCTDCAAGTISAAAGAYGAPDSSHGCQSCFVGQYAAAGTDSCIDCAAGTVDDDSNPATTCESCAAGTYAPAGQTSCANCAAGQADADSNSGTPCDACQAGQYAAAGSVSCTDCAAGQYDDDDDAATACVFCSAGTAAAAAQTACTACSVGQYVAVGGATCDDCAAGQHDDDNDPSTPCSACQAGQYASAGGVSCANCGAGQYDDDGDAATACVACASDTYTDGSASSSCTGCTPVANSAGNVTCTSAHDSQVTACAPGYTLTEGVADTCAPNTCTARTTPVAGYDILPTCEGRTTASIACSVLHSCANGYFGTADVSQITCLAPGDELSLSGCTACTPVPNAANDSVVCTSPTDSQVTACQPGYKLGFTAAKSDSYPYMTVKANCGLVTDAAASATAGTLHARLAELSKLLQDGMITAQEYVSNDRLGLPLTLTPTVAANRRRQDEFFLCWTICRQSKPCCL